MNRLLQWLSLSLFLALAGVCRSQDTNAAAQKPADPNDLTEKQVAALITELPDAKTGTKLVFSATFAARDVPASQKAAYVQSGKVPFRIICSFNESKAVGSRTVEKRLGGTAHIVIRDAEGKIVDSKAMPLDKMCES